VPLLIIIIIIIIIQCNVMIYILYYIILYYRERWGITENNGTNFIVTIEKWRENVRERERERGREFWNGERMFNHTDKAERKISPMVNASFH